MKKMNVILVLRTGGDFAFPDVHMISHHIKKQSEGVNLYCLTNLFEKEQVLKPCTVLPIPNSWAGWWSKMNLFSPELEKYRPFLFLDLDTAVVGDIRHLMLTEDIEHSFVMLRDFYRLIQPASGVMWIPANSKKVSQIWDAWNQDPLGNMKKYRGDQEFIRSVTKPDLYWQDIKKGIYTFKPTQKIWRQELPEDSILVCFHGKPRIWDAIGKVKWVYNYVYDK